MNKTTLGIVIAILSIGLIGGIVYFNSQTASDPQPTRTQDVRSDGINQGGDAAGQEINSGNVTMNIKDFNFETQELKVKVGTKVTWKNQDSARHDITPDNESPDFVGSNKLLAKGESYSYTFEKAGMFAYYCTPHPYMRASVEVVE